MPRLSLMRSARAMMQFVLAVAPLQLLHAEDTTRPVAVLEGSKPGVRIEVLGLKRSEGGMLTLRLAFVNDSAGQIKNGDFPGEGANEGFGDIVLVDYVNKKKYLIVTDSTGTCLCTTNSLSPPWPFDPGRKVLWAKFPAPPETVQRISILIGKEEPLDDVPITR